MNRSWNEDPQCAASRGSVPALAANVQTLWRLRWNCIPEMVEVFDRLRFSIGRIETGQILQRLYQRTESRDFSCHLPAHATDNTAMIEMQSMLCDDWGRAQRIRDCQAAQADSTIP
jgi:hypothetical protein